MDEKAIKNETNLISYQLLSESNLANLDSDMVDLSPIDQEYFDIVRR